MKVGSYEFIKFKETYLKDAKEIVVIGPPASGKTSISEKLGIEPTIHTDDYMQYGFQDSLYVLIEDLVANKGHEVRLVEGMLGYRLLRKGFETKKYFPDLIIQIDCAQSTIDRRYHKERDPKKLKDVEKFMKANETILNQYNELLVSNNVPKPKWIIVNNTDGPSFWESFDRMMEEGGPKFNH